MPRAKGQVPKPGKVAIIDPRMVFTVETLRATLGLRQGSLPREIRQKRLKAHRICGRYFILGADVLLWIKGGEIERRETTGTACILNNES